MTDEYRGPNGEPSIAVHITSQPQTKKPRYRTEFMTRVINPARNHENILPPSERRYVAYIQPLDDNIVIAGNESDAQNLAGAIIQKSNTTPWPIWESSDVYAAVPSFSGATSRIVIMAVYLTDES